MFIIKQIVITYHNIPIQVNECDIETNDIESIRVQKLNEYLTINSIKETYKEFYAIQLTYKFK